MRTSKFCCSTWVWALLIARVALTAGTAAQLVVDPAGFVPLRAQDIQAAGLAHLCGVGVGLPLEFLIQLGKARADGQHFGVVGLRMAVGFIKQLGAVVALAQLVQRHGLRIAAEHNIGAAARHVGRDRHRAGFTGLRDDIRLFFMVFGVQNRVFDALFLQNGRKLFGFLNRNGAHQNRLALGVAFFNARNGRLDLAVFVLVYRVRIVLTGDGLVGRNLDHIQLIDVAEFFLLGQLGQRGARHAGQLAVQTEIILERDGGKGLGLMRDLDAFLGFDGLVQAFVIAAAEHQTAGKLVHNDDLSIAYNVVHIALHDAAGLDGLVDVMLQRGILGVGQVIHPEIRLRLGLAVRRERGRAGFFVHNIVGGNVVLLLLGVHFLDAQALEAGRKPVGHLIQLGGLLALAGNDQRGTRLVDEDGVHLVHNGKSVAALHHSLLIDGHIIAQIVKTELIVGAVGDIRLVHRAALCRLHLMNNQADR